jgi:hypothetical protein
MVYKNKKATGLFKKQWLFVAGYLCLLYWLFYADKRTPSLGLSLQER